MQGIWSHKTRKGSRIVKLDMTSEKNMRMEEIGNGQQEMQEKIARRTKVVMDLTKGKGITEGPNLQEEPTSWKDGIDPSIGPNPNDFCQRERLRKEPSGQLKHINKQQRCSFLDKKLKKIEAVNDLGSVDPRELSLVSDVVITPKFKMPKFEKYDHVSQMKGKRKIHSKARHKV